MNVLKKKMIDICKANQFIRTSVRSIRNVKLKIIFDEFYRKNKIDSKVIIFESYMGRKYACSPKAIYEEMLEMEIFSDFIFVWAFREPNTKKNIDKLKRSVLVKYNSKEYFEYYSKAKYVVSNSRIPEIIKLKDEQIYVQTWHGTPLKKLGYDIEIDGGNAMNSLKDLRKKYKDDAVRYTYLISPSKFVTEKYKTCFNLKENNSNVEIIEKGYPRNDFLYNFTYQDINNIKANLNISQNKKIILYAPTWRDNQHESGIGYTYNLGINFDNLKEKMSDDYIILFRAHYFVANQFDFEKYSGFLYNVSDYEDINDLYIISDMLITDYSSVFFDYANLKRPIIFYMYDLNEYIERIRGFYLNLDELPGHIIQNEDELLEEISNKTNAFVYEEKYIKFNEKFNYLDDGKASERVIGEIFNGTK